MARSHSLEVDQRGTSDKAFSLGSNEGAENSYMHPKLIRISTQKYSIYNDANRYDRNVPINGR